MKIHDLPTHRRPREKLVAQGGQTLSDAELLAILIRTGYHGKSALEIAQRVLRQVSLNDLLRLPLPELAKLKGVGWSRAVLFNAVQALIFRYGHQSALPRVQTAQDIALLLSDIKKKKQEYLVALYLNSRYELLHQQVITIGLLSSNLVHAREVYAPALEQRAAAVIIAHNHPTGDLQPSAEDIDTTDKLVEAGQILDIPLIDHVIIADQGWFSFREHKLLLNEEVLH